MNILGTKIGINPEDKGEDTTEEIRTRKHSSLLQADLEKFTELKKLNLSKDEFTERCKMQMLFFYTSYPKIFNYLMEGWVDLSILRKLLLVLKLIEDGHLNKYEGEVKVGEILGDIYLTGAKQLEAAAAAEAEAKGELPPTASQQDAPTGDVIINLMTWKEFKAKREVQAAAVLKATQPTTSTVKKRANRKQH